MTIRLDVRTGHWFYRFSKGGKSYFAGGFRLKDQAREAEVKRFDKVTDEEINPQRRGQDLTFEGAAKKWLDGKTEEVRLHKRRHGTVKNYTARIGIAIKYFGDTKLKFIKESDMESFLDQLPTLTGRAIGTHTRNHYRQALLTMFNGLNKKKEYFGENPCKTVEVLAVARNKVRFLYPAEEKILSPIVAKDSVAWPHYVVGILTGARIEEIRRMKVRDLDFVMQHIFIPNSKNGRSRYIPMSSELVQFLTALVQGKRPDDTVLVNWTYSYIRKQFTKCIREAGIPDFTFHCLRHTFAQRLLGKGASIYKVSKILGHSSVRVTEEHYGHLATADLANEVEKIDGVLSCGLQPSCSGVGRIAEVLEKSELSAA